MRWNDKVPCCVNCGSDATERRPRGYCSRCFPDAERLRQIERWDPNDSTTWIGGSYRGYNLGMSGEEYIARCRDILERRLAHRVHIEQVRREEEDVDGLALEYAFDKLARAAGARRPRLFHGWATTLSHRFDNYQRRLLYCMIDKIISDRPPKTMWTQPLRDDIMGRGVRHRI